MESATSTFQRLSVSSQELLVQVSLPRFLRPLKSRHQSETPPNSASFFSLESRGRPSAAAEMENKALVVYTVVVFLGLLVIATGFAAEGTKVKVKMLFLTHDLLIAWFFLSWIFCLVDEKIRRKESYGIVLKGSFNVLIWKLYMKKLFVNLKLRLDWNCLPYWMDLLFLLCNN